MCRYDWVIANLMLLNHRDLWDTKQVKSELAAHAISEGKLFLYVFAIMGFDWLQLTAIRLSAVSGVIADWERVDAWSTFCLRAIGLVFLFVCNGGTRGRIFSTGISRCRLLWAGNLSRHRFVAMPAVKMLLSGATPNVSAAGRYPLHWWP